MKLRSKSVPPRNVENHENRSKKRQLLIPLIDCEKVTQSNQDRMKLRTKSSVISDENHLNKRVKKSTASHGKIEGNINDSKTESPSVSVTVCNSKKTIKKNSDQHQQSNQDRPQLKSKSAVTSDENHLNKRVEKSTASHGKIEGNISDSKIESPSVSVTVRNSKKTIKKNSDQHQQTNQDRMELRSKSAVDRAKTTSNENSDRQKIQRSENCLACRIELKRSSFITGSVVLVKWPSFPYWPARVTNISKKTVDVIFFGDNSRSAKVKIEQIFDFQTNPDYLLRTMKCRQWKLVYAKAVRETEIYIGIPSKESIINMIDGK